MVYQLSWTTRTGPSPEKIWTAVAVHPDHPGPPGPNRDLAPNRNCGHNGWFDRTIPRRKLRPQCRSTRTTPDHPDHSPKKIETAMPVHPDHPGPPGPDRGPQELHERDPDMMGAGTVERLPIIHGDLE